ncbi:type II secretion system protein [Anaeromyxobacter dehalogenans 2CP-1]|uniref:Type II secretion system protein n=1 Tax=Anaeromyxobacter dehalogenans (strain ATCC BAA-258 / DSM 21875 / 2CP-1) TaxID=455488 RepID=B8JFG9_ANAD2|nr:type II secretion system F family protein [Anaeromyxobacter dehalogenans]ACL66346.1 type II secretion system protein [Anaeromyxobacter dehalogenans 2CP-1]
MRFDPLAFGIALLGLVGLVGLAAAWVAIARRSGALVADRLADPATVDPFASTIEPIVETPAATRSALGRALDVLTRFARPMGDEAARLQLRLEQGGFRGPHAVSVHLALKLTLAVGLLLTFLFVNAHRAERIEPAFVVAVLAFAAGFYLPDLLLTSRISSRQLTLERGLPDALDLLVTCVEAGLGLDASVQRVSEEIHRAWPQLATELRTTFLEVKAGIPRIEAFRRLATRTGVKDLKSLSATLAQTEIFGTSVALALRVQSDGMRVRRMHRAEEKAAYVSVKMTLPLILCILPSLLAVIMGPAIIGIMRALMPALGGK